ncbi:hybrid sensor histidine kinase/response regulator [Lacibacter sp.]|uniref:hybrid sensor histidine kinase/response regulator n=1 Tax=Lacibacter sp. TaxID=1915409 RepID=UPI002B4B3A79|nr:response regulator [Lacibacter sp.]HLP35951.1 response regulator [Lacibacter sp.]
MKKVLHIVHLEDLDSDAELVAYVLKNGGISCVIRRAVNRQQFEELLQYSRPDLILSDHSLPSFNSQEALQIVQRLDVSIPFILITSTVSEDYAVQIMKQGASDYILKDRMQRLPNAVTAAIEKYEAEATLARQRILQEKLIVRTSIRAQEKVRNEIGIELHDNINQILAASKLFLDKALKQTTEQEELLVRCKEHLVNAIEEIRRLSHQIVTPSLESISLGQIIRDLIEDVHQSSPLQISFSADGFDEEQVCRELKLTLYRIVQEQLNNILKHSEAGNAFIRIYPDAQSLNLLIGDDGKGANLEEKGNGIGLNNIRSRVGYFDGELLIQTAPGKGFTLKAKIPVTKLAEPSTADE